MIPSPDVNALIPLAVAWILYGLLHSLLASLRWKAWLARRVPSLMPNYRLIFNVTAIVTVLPILWLLVRANGPYLWQWRGAWHWLAIGLTVAAGIAFLISLAAYDLGEFTGLRAGQMPGTLLDAGDFRIGIFHRHVRHPWYFFSLVAIWVQDMNAAILVTALAITAYLVVGTYFEERKLIARYGATYERYKARVPGLFPLPWKWLTAEEAADLVRSQPPPPFPDPPPKPTNDGR